jgi:four helix bundle protein
VAPARHFSQLVCWQLADALRVETLKLTVKPPFAKDFKFRSQTEDAVDSVCRNIAEGFGCESHAEFARYLEISRRSVNELRDCFRSAHLKGYASGLDLSPGYSLMNRLFPALNNFIAYLRRTPNQRRTDTRKPRRTDKKPRRTDKDQNRTDN